MTRKCRSVLPALVLAGAAWASPSLSTQPGGDAWRASILRARLPPEGCYTAAYPSTVWVRVACSNVVALPTGLPSPARAFSVGSHNDYAAVVSGLIASSIGSFPKVTGLKRETGLENTPNRYSLQLNSNYFVTPACSGAKVPASCRGWEQFVFANPGGPGTVYIQYWLLNYGSTCPGGQWLPYDGSCYLSGKPADVPSQVITQLKELRLFGAADSSGIDRVILTTAAGAYTAVGTNTGLQLAGNWNAAEFNLFGDSDRSAANVNPGSSVVVKVAVRDGTTNAPDCVANRGTTGETNNLYLGLCDKAGGSVPYIQFTESVGASYDAFKQFSSKNPSGPWMYGEGKSGSSFTAYSTYQTNAGGFTDFNRWFSGGPPPYVGTNQSAKTYEAETALVPEKQMLMHPGPTTDSILQWTAPQAGTYRVEGFYEILDDSPTGITALIYDNTKNITTMAFNGGSGTITGPGADLGAKQPGGKESFSFLLKASMGDVISFGVNNDGDYYNDTTGVSVAIGRIIP